MTQTGALLLCSAQETYHVYKPSNVGQRSSGCTLDISCFQPTLHFPRNIFPSYQLGAIAELQERPNMHACSSIRVAENVDNKTPRYCTPEQEVTGENPKDTAVDFDLMCYCQSSIPLTRGYPKCMHGSNLSMSAVQLR